MPEDRISFPQLARKGFHVSVPAADETTWARMAAPDPSVPRTFARLREYGRLLYGPRRRRNRRTIGDLPRTGAMRSLYGECGEAAWHRLFLALGHPGLSRAQREAVEAEIDADLPTFEHSTQTQHFVLRWTDSSTISTDNITDASVVTETGGYLEDAWLRYQTSFGRTPYVPSGSAKMEVVFYDIPGAYGVASPADGPLQLNSNALVTTPGMRRSVSAHELFHKLQYAFGFRTAWNPSWPYQWFSEGLSSWAEVNVWQRVSRAAKITDLFSNPDLDLYQASYSALPFWIFFEVRQKSDPADNPVLHFLTTCEPTGDITTALSQVIDEEWPAGNVYGQLDNFFALFARERRIGAWRTGPTGGLYPSIHGPDEAVIAPALAVTDVPLGLSDTYTVAATVSPLGTDYYRFALEPDADGENVSLSVAGAAAGDYSYYLIWEKKSSWKRAAFPPGSSASYSHAEVVNLNDADALVLAVSGRGKGGAYTLTASIT
jgi:hypothetical protein